MYSQNQSRLKQKFFSQQSCNPDFSKLGYNYGVPLHKTGDTIAGFLYIFAIGTGRLIDNPPTHPFYTVFLGSFFLCFAYLQFLSAFNIRRYTFNVGCLIIGRLFYVFQLYDYMLFVTDFPATFWFTGIIDGIFTMLYFVFAFRSGLGMRELFLPEKKTKIS